MMSPRWGLWSVSTLYPRLTSWATVIPALWGFSNSLSLAATRTRLYNPCHALNCICAPVAQWLEQRTQALWSLSGKSYKSFPYDFQRWVASLSHYTIEIVSVFGHVFRHACRICQIRGSLSQQKRYGNPEPSPAMKMIDDSGKGVETCWQARKAKGKSRPQTPVVAGLQVYQSSIGARRKP